MAIEDLLLTTASSAYYSPEFRDVIEAHIGYLYDHPQTTINTVDAMDLYVYDFDFYGMLIKMGVPPELHFATLRMARLTSPQDNFGHLELIRIPDKGVLQKILQRWQAKSRA